MEGRTWRILLAIVVFSGCFFIGNQLAAADVNGESGTAIEANQERGASAEAGQLLPGYENTVWGVTAADGQAVSGLTPRMAEELAGARRAGQGIRVRVDGQEVDFPDRQPLLEKGRVLVPLRALLESEYVQCRVSWQEENRQAVVTDQKGRQVIFRPGESSYEVIEAGGQTGGYPLDVPAMMKEGRVYLPLRVLLETFAYKVAWLEPEQLVDIQDTYPGWRRLLPPDSWKQLLAEGCEPCALLKEAP